MSTIIIDYRLAGSGGLGRFIESLTPFLNNQSKYFLILNIEQSLPDLPFSYNVIRFKSKILSLGEQFEYFLKLPRADILFTPFFNVPLGFPLCRPKYLVSMVHDLYHLDMSHHKHTLIKLTYQVFLFASVRYSAHIFTVSFFSLRRLLLHFPQIPPSSILYNAINDSLSIKCNTSNVHPALISFYASGSKPMLFVGNLKIHKNLIELIKVLQSCPSLRLVVAGTSVGRSSIYQMLKQMTNDLSLSQRIFFAGRVSENELTYCYQSSRALLLPSLYEGFGIPLIEAQSLGLPVLCSNIPVFKEIAGDSVLYFSPFRDSIVSCIETFIAMDSSQLDSLIMRGYTNASKFSWSKSAKHASNVFHMLSA